MAYATDQERIALMNATFPLELVVRIRKNGRESEICADDVKHALTLSANWINRHQADYVEIFRVNPDGSLKPTIGAHGQA